MKYCILFLFGYLAVESNAYVLLQVRKDANHSNVDAVIHKQVSSEKFDKIAQKISRKQLRSRISDPEESSSDEAAEPKAPLAVGLNTGPKFRGSSSDGVDRLVQAVQDIFSTNFQEPLFRSKNFELNDPHFKQTKTRGIELDTQTLLNSVKKFISSRKFKRTAEDLARKAAIIFRALKEDL